MGDRANFGFVQPNGETIVLYGHWAGYHMLANLAEAVAKAQPRWSDPSYATRIAISNLIGDGWSMETGWGLHVNEIGDNEHKIAIVDFTQMAFSLHEEDSFYNLDYTQLILEFYTQGVPDSGWVHVSYDPNNLKKQELTATKIAGKTTYLNGLVA